VSIVWGGRWVRAGDLDVLSSGFGPSRTGSARPSDEREGDLTDHPEDPGKGASPLLSDKILLAAYTGTDRPGGLVAAVTRGGVGIGWEQSTDLQLRGGVQRHRRPTRRDGGWGWAVVTLQLDHLQQVRRRSTRVMGLSRQVQVRSEKNLSLSPFTVGWQRVGGAVGAAVPKDSGQSMLVTLAAFTGWEK
jgi:hypothetical protein